MSASDQPFWWESLSDTEYILARDVLTRDLGRCTRVRMLMDDVDLASDAGFAVLTDQLAATRRVLVNPSAAERLRQEELAPFVPFRPTARSAGRETRGLPHLGAIGLAAGVSGFLPSAVTALGYWARRLDRRTIRPGLSPRDRQELADQRHQLRQAVTLLRDCAAIAVHLASDPAAAPSPLVSTALGLPLVWRHLLPPRQMLDLLLALGELARNHPTAESIPAQWLTCVASSLLPSDWSDLGAEGVLELLPSPNPLLRALAAEATPWVAPGSGIARRAPDTETARQALCFAPGFDVEATDLAEVLQWKVRLFEASRAPGGSVLGLLLPRVRFAVGVPGLTARIDPQSCEPQDGGANGAPGHRAQPVLRLGAGWRPPSAELIAALDAAVAQWNAEQRAPRAPAPEVRR